MDLSLVIQLIKPITNTVQHQEG